MNTKYNIPRDIETFYPRNNNKRILQRKDWQSVWRKHLTQKSKTKSQRTEKENQRIKPAFKISTRERREKTRMEDQRNNTNTAPRMKKRLCFSN